MKVWQVMTVFDLQLNSDPSGDIQKSDRHTIFSNIKALYEDALDYALLGKPKAEKEPANTHQNIISLEEVIWSASEAENMSANPVARKNRPSDSTAHNSTSDNTPDASSDKFGHDEFDQLLFRLMKDMNRLDGSDKIYPFRKRSASRPRSDNRPANPAKNAKDEPYIPIYQHGHMATAEKPEIEDIPQQPATSLPDVLREPLSELVYQQIEHRIKLWIDRNLEQIVEDALRYEETGSRDST